MIKMTDNELYHYGTPRHSGRYPYGSGSRPFQGNPEMYKKYKELSKDIDQNGRLTESGKKKFIDFDNYVNTNVYTNNKRYLNREIDEANIQRVKKKDGYGDDYIIPKDQNVYRVTNKKTDLDKANRLYVAVTDRDRDDYIGYGKSGDLGYKKGSDTKLETYKAQKALKVAGEKEVIDMVLEKYGDKTLSEIGKLRPHYQTFVNKNDMEDIVKRYENVPIKNFFTDSAIDDMYVKAAFGKSIGTNSVFKDDDRKYLEWRAFTGNTAVRTILYNNTFKNKKVDDEFVKTLANKGYDAFVDMEDSLYQGLPIVMLQPAKNLKFESIEDVK